MPRILLVDHHDSFTYNLVELLRKLALPFEVLSSEDIELDAVENFSHLLLSPGPDVPSAYPQSLALLARYYRDKPILGICLGHQMLCEFFGAGLFNLGKVRHGQQTELSLAPDSRLFKGLTAPVKVGLYHSWAVSPQAFPPQLRITAYCQHKVIMAMEHRSLPIYGIQFHPESFLSPDGLQMVDNWIQAT